MIELMCMFTFLASVFIIALACAIWDEVADIKKQLREIALRKMVENGPVITPTLPDFYRLLHRYDDKKEKCASEQTEK